jgi:hypothetical protein
MNKKSLKIAEIALPTLLAGFLSAGCGGTPASSNTTSSANSGSSSSTSSSKSWVEPTPFDGTGYYDSVASRVAYQDGSELSFDEDFSSGTMNDDLFWVIDGYWDAGGTTNWHNGVRSRNLRYVKNGSDTYLGIKARGSYCHDADMVKTSAGHIKPEGACIMTKNFLKPGRFEINMATMPREGAVTAMWTYYSKTGSEATSQNEIDIEIGGDAQYTNEWTTTWTTHTDKETDSVDVSKVCYLNDGKFHKYTFDWYTNYGPNGLKRVDWFVDGILIKSITGTSVPEMMMPLWIGLWCPSWAGNPYFAYDYMLVKDIAYKEFDENSQYVDEVRNSNPAYTHTNPSASSIASEAYAATQSVEKLGNTDFESLTKCVTDDSYFGWTPENASLGTVTLSDEHSEGSHSYQLNASTTSSEEYHGEYLDAKVSLAYPGYQYAYSVDAKLLTASSKGNLEIRYKDKNGSTIKTETKAVSGTSWATLSGTVTMPAKSASLQLTLTAEDGSVLYDNASLKFKGLAA